MLRHLAPLLKNRHVVVRTDSVTVVAYINRRGSVHSARLLEIGRGLLLWSYRHLLSNRAVDLMLHGDPSHNVWKLSPALRSDVVRQL